MIRLPLGVQAVRRSSAVDSPSGSCGFLRTAGARAAVGIDLKARTALWPPKPKLSLSATRWKRRRWART